MVDINLEIFHTDVSIDMHKDVVQKSLNAVDDDISKILGRKLLEKSKYFTYVRCDEDDYNDCFEKSFLFAKILAYYYDGWAIVRLHVDGERNVFLMNKDFGIVKAEEIDGWMDDSIKLHKYKTEFLRSYKALKELGVDVMELLEGEVNDVVVE